MGVGVEPEALGAGRRHVGVGLHGVAERALEVAAEPGQRQPLALEALEHDGGAGREVGVDPADVGHVVEHLRPEADALGVGLRVEGLAVPDEAEGGAPHERGGQQVVDVVERQQVVVPPAPARRRSSTRRAQCSWRKRSTSPTHRRSALPSPSVIAPSWPTAGPGVPGGQG